MLDALSIMLYALCLMQVSRREEKRRHRALRESLLRTHLSPRAMDRRRAAAVRGVHPEGYGSGRGDSSTSIPYLMNIGFVASAVY